MRRHAITALSAAALVVVGLAQTAPGRAALRGLDLAQPSARYTELYFADPQAAATAAEGTSPHPARQVVRFVIQDVASTAQHYHWTLAVDGRPVDRETLHVPARYGVALSRTVDTGCAAGARRRMAKHLITVSLQVPREQISYHVACHG